MKRYHDEIAGTMRQWKIHRRSHVESNKYRNRLGVSVYVVDCECDEQIGRFRKKDAYDCGNTRCGICHSDKFPKRTPHEQESISEMGFEEQIRELHE